MSEGRCIEVGRVAARHEGGVLEISMSAGGECEKCGLCKRSGDDNVLLQVRDDGELDVGQAVRIVFPYNSHWRPIIYVFALPLAAFLVTGIGSGVLAEALGMGRTAGLVTACLSAAGGLAAALLVARRADARFRREVFEHTRVEATSEGE